MQPTIRTPTLSVHQAAHEKDVLQRGALRGLFEVRRRAVATVDVLVVGKRLAGSLPRDCARNPNWWACRAGNGCVQAMAVRTAAGSGSCSL